MAHESNWSGGGIFRRPGYAQRLNQIRKVLRRVDSNRGALGNATTDLVPPQPATRYLGQRTSGAVSLRRASGSYTRRSPVPYIRRFQELIGDGPTNDFTFTGGDGAAWGPGWTFTQGSGDVLTNRGRMVTGTANFAGVSAFYNHGIVDADVRIDVEIPTADAQFPEIRFRYSNSSGDGLAIIFEPHNDIAQVYPYSAFTRGAQIGANIPITIAAGDIVNVRLASVGSYHKFKVWTNSNPEPADWNREFSSSSGAGNTSLMVRTVTSDLGVAITNYWDDFSVTTATLTLTNMVAGINARVA